MGQSESSSGNGCLLHAKKKKQIHQSKFGVFFSPRLVMMSLQESPLFEGLPGRLLLTYDLTALEMRMYYKAGVLIGWSLAHGGPGPRCLHPALFQVGTMCF